MSLTAYGREEKRKKEKRKKEEEKKRKKKKKKGRRRGKRCSLQQSVSVLCWQQNRKTRNQRLESRAEHTNLRPTDH